MLQCSLCFTEDVESGECDRICCDVESQLLAAGKIVTVLASCCISGVRERGSDFWQRQHASTCTPCFYISIKSICLLVCTYFLIIKLQATHNALERTMHCVSSKAQASLSLYIYTHIFMST